MPTDRRPHRTDRKRGSRRKVAPGVFERAGKYLVSYTDAEGDDRIKTVGWIKSDRHADGVTLTQAKAIREQLRVQVRTGHLPVPTKASVSEVAEDFLAMFESLVAAGEKSERTLEVYRQRYHTHLDKPLGRVAIQKLTAAHVSRLLAELRRSGKSSWTIVGIYRLLSVIVNHALSRGLINESPLKRLSRTERPTARNATRARLLTDEQIDALLDHALPTYQPLLATAAFTGMRQSELLGLRWSDVDFDARVIRVRHQLTRATSTSPAQLKALKSDAAERDIYLLPRLAARLKTHREQAFARGHAKPTDYVFATHTGTPMYYRNVSARGLDRAAQRSRPEQRQRTEAHHARPAPHVRLTARRRRPRRRRSATAGRSRAPVDHARQIRGRVQARTTAQGQHPRQARGNRFRLLIRPHPDHTLEVGRARVM
jgi:integrase